MPQYTVALGFCMVRFWNVIGMALTSCEIAYHFGMSFRQVPSAASGRATETGCSTGHEIMKPADEFYGFKARSLDSDNEAHPACADYQQIPSLYTLSLPYHCLNYRLLCVTSTFH